MAGAPTAASAAGVIVFSRPCAGRVARQNLCSDFFSAKHRAVTSAPSFPSAPSRTKSLTIKSQAPPPPPPPPSPPSAPRQPPVTASLSPADSAAAAAVSSSSPAATVVRRATALAPVGGLRSRFQSKLITMPRPDGAFDVLEAPAGSADNPLKALLPNERACAVLDGGFATELEARGANLADPLWSAKCLLDSPEMVSAVHADYFQSGADVVLTGSYQASIQGFSEQRGLSAEASSTILKRSSDLACRARDEFWASLPDGSRRRYPLVAASIGCYGAYLADGSEYRGYNKSVTIETLKNFHRPRVAALVESSADILAFETVPALEEAVAIASLLSEEFPTAHAWISFVCKDGTSTTGGDAFRDCVVVADKCPQIVGVGANCTPPRFVLSLLKEARQATDKILIVYPNSGEGWDAVNKQWTPGTQFHDHDFGKMVPAWRAAGAQLIGGCCRTGPSTIRAIANAIQREEQGDDFRLHQK